MKRLVKLSVGANWVEENFDEYDRDLAVSLTQTLIRAKSVNPPGNEKSAAEIVAEVLKSHGDFKIEFNEFAENRSNLIATYGNYDNISLILNGHLDVVPASGEWKYDPWGGEIAEDKIYGRGSSDMLGGCAAVVAAACCIARKGWDANLGFMVILVGDEEDINRGMRHLLSTHELSADAVVVAEPTNMEICLGNRGYSSFTLETHGRPSHASRPWEGDNAIYKMARAIVKLQEYASNLSGVTDLFLGQATASVGMINGGIKLNTVPDYCYAELERRLLPGEKIEVIKKEIQDIAGDDCTVKDRSFLPASLIDRQNNLVLVCESLISDVLNKEPKTTVFSACTEAGLFSVNAGIPTLILGPGSIGRAHKEDEWSSVNDIVDCARLFTALICEYTG